MPSLISRAMLLHCALIGALSAAPTTGFYYTGSTTSYISQGQSELLTAENGAIITTTPNYNNEASFSVRRADSPSYSWSLKFAAPGNALITPGSYSQATRWPFQSALMAGLDFYGNGRGNNDLTGSFTVREAAYAGDGTIQSFAADFVQYDGGVLADWSRGSIRYNSAYELPVKTFATDTRLEVGGFTTTDVTVSGLGTVVFTGENSYETTTIRSGTLQIGDGGVSGNIGSGPVNLAGTLVVNRVDDVTLHGDISGDGRLIQKGTGTLILAGHLSGGLTVESGSVALAAPARFNGTNTPLVIAAGGTLVLGGNESLGTGSADISGTLSGTGALTASAYRLHGGRVTANLGPGSLANDGDSRLSGTTATTNLTVNAGTLTLDQGGRLTGGDVTLAIAQGATLRLGGDESLGAGNAEIRGALSGSGTLTAAAYRLQGAQVDANLGPGTLTAGDTNRLSGKISATTIRINPGALTLDQGGRFIGANPELILSRNATLTLGGDEALGTGTATLAGTLNSAEPGATLTAANYVLKNGVINADLGAGSLRVGTPPPPSPVSPSAPSGSGASGSGTLDLGGGSSSAGTLSLGGGSVSVGTFVSGGTGTLAGGAGTISFNPSGGMTGGVLGGIGGGTVTALPISLSQGSASFTKVGAGAITLAAVAPAPTPMPDPDLTEGDVVLNGLTRATSVAVNAHTLTLGSPGRLAGGDVTLTVAPGATLVLGGDENLGSGSVSIAGTLSGAGVLSASTVSLSGATVSAGLGAGSLISNGTTTLSGVSAANSVTVASGRLTVSGGFAFADTATVSVAPGAALIVATAETAGRLIAGSGSTVELRDTLTLSTGGDIAASAVTGAGAIVITSGSLGFDAHDGVLATAVSGAGNIALTGAGITTLDASRLNNRQVVIGAGHTVDLGRDTALRQAAMFVVESGATLRGRGSIGALTVNAGGAFKPGNSPGIVHINGNFINNGILVMEIAGNGGPGAANGYDQVNAAGRVTVNGTLSITLTNGFTPAGGGTQRYELFTSGIGAISGAALADAVLPTGTLGLLSVSGTSLAYTSYDSFAALPGVTLSAAAIAAADSLIPQGAGPGTPAARLLTIYQTGGAAALQSSLNTVSPRPLVALTTLPVEQARGTAETIRTRLDALRRPALGAKGGEWATFATLAGAESTTDASFTDFDRRTFGGKIGLENRVATDLGVGLAVGYDKGRAELHDHGGRIDQEHLTLAAYLGSRFDDNTFVYVGAFAGLSDYEIRRNAGFGTIHGDTDGRDYGVTVALGRVFDIMADFTVTPYAGLTATWAYADGYTESGLINASIHDHRQVSLRSKLGADLDRAVLSTPTSSVRFGLAVAWEHEISGNSVTVPASFGGTVVETSSPGIARDIISIGPVCTLEWEGGNAIRLAVQKQYGFGDESGSRFDLAYSKRF